MNANEFAVEITRQEGLKKQVNIAQIKEVLKVIRQILKKESGIDIYSIIKTL